MAPPPFLITFIYNGKGGKNVPLLESSSEKEEVIFTESHFWRKLFIGVKRDSRKTLTLYFLQRANQPPYLRLPLRFFQASRFRKKFISSVTRML